MFKEGDEVICVVPTFDNQLILGQLYIIGEYSYNIVQIIGKVPFFECTRFRLATPLNKALS